MILIPLLVLCPVKALGEAKRFIKSCLLQFQLILDYCMPDYKMKYKKIAIERQFLYKQSFSTYISTKKGFFGTPTRN